MKKLPFEIKEFTFIPDWAKVGATRLGELGWRKITMDENPPDVRVGHWLMHRIGRPSRPVTCTITKTPERDEFMCCAVLIYAHDGKSRLWSPVCIGQIRVEFVVPPPWLHCLICGRLDIAEYCDCEFRDRGPYGQPREVRGVRNAH